MGTGLIFHQVALFAQHGLTPREAMQLLQGLSGLDVIGGDVVEIAPQYDSTTNTVHVGAQILFEILALMALSPSW